MPRWSETSTQPKPLELWTPEEWSMNIDVPRFGGKWIYCSTPPIAERFSDMYRRTREYQIQIPGVANEELMELANKISVYKGESDKFQYVDPKTKEEHLIIRQPLNTDFNYISPEIESISMVPPYPNITFDDTWECTENSDGKRTYTKRRKVNERKNLYVRNAKKVSKKDLIF